MFLVKVTILNLKQNQQTFGIKSDFEIKIENAILVKMKEIHK